MNKQIFVGGLCAFIATFFWASSLIVARLAVGEISPLILGAARAILALLLLCLVLVPQARREWHATKAFLPQITFGALVGVAAFAPLSYFAAQSTSALNLSLISVTTPVFIMLLDSLRGQRYSLHCWGGGALALLGACYLVSGGDIESLWHLQFTKGDIIMFCAILGFALYSIVIKNPPQGISSGTIMLWMTFLATIMLIPSAVWEMQQEYAVFHYNGMVLFCIVFSAICSSIIPWWAWNVALQKAGASLSSGIYFSLPLWAGVQAYAILGENMSHVHAISGCLIIGGIVWANRGVMVTQGKKKGEKS